MTLAHGVSHLLGHVHDTEMTANAMAAHERRLLKAVESRDSFNTAGAYWQWDAGGEGGGRLGPSPPTTTHRQPRPPRALSPLTTGPD